MSNGYRVEYEAIVHLVIISVVSVVAVWNIIFVARTHYCPESSTKNKNRNSSSNKEVSGNAAYAKHNVFAFKAVVLCVQFFLVLYYATWIADGKNLKTVETAAVVGVCVCFGLNQMLIGVIIISKLCVFNNTTYEVSKRRKYAYHGLLAVCTVCASLSLVIFYFCVILLVCDVMLFMSVTRDFVLRVIRMVRRQRQSIGM